MRIKRDSLDCVGPYSLFFLNNVKGKNPEQALIPLFWGRVPFQAPKPNKGTLCIAGLLLGLLKNPKP